MQSDLSPENLTVNIAMFALAVNIAPSLWVYQSITLQFEFIIIVNEAL